MINAKSKSPNKKESKGKIKESRNIKSRLNSGNQFSHSTHLDLSTNSSYTNIKSNVLPELIKNQQSFIWREYNRIMKPLHHRVNATDMYNKLNQNINEFINSAYIKKPRKTTIDLNYQDAGLKEK